MLLLYFLLCFVKIKFNSSKQAPPPFFLLAPPVAARGPAARDRHATDLPAHIATATRLQVERKDDNQHLGRSRKSMAFTVNTPPPEKLFLSP